jgi:hypothetical protein
LIFLFVIFELCLYTNRITRKKNVVKNKERKRVKKGSSKEQNKKKETLCASVYACVCVCVYMRSFELVVEIIKP